VAKQKLKTHKGAKKRFKFTATGKLMRAKGMKSHFRRRKAPRTGQIRSAKGMKSHFRRRKAARVKRQFDRTIEVSETNVTRIKRMLPYGS
jgi:large subunit ribosomal protein L35